MVNRFQFIQDDHETFPVKRLCEVLEHADAPTAGELVYAVDVGEEDRPFAVILRIFPRNRRRSTELLLASACRVVPRFLGGVPLPSKWTVLGLLRSIRIDGRELVPLTGGNGTVRP